LAALVAPTFVVANFAVTGVNLACAVPVPDNDTVCGLLGELSVNVKVPVRVPICVGVNVTSITQLLPAAKVLPQGFVLATVAKSPLVAMLVMFKVTVPVLVRVTAFFGAVAPTTTLPHVSVEGVTVTVGPVVTGFTVRLIVVLPLTLPETPLMVTVTVPVVAVALAVKVSVLVVVAGFGLNPAVTPVGKPAADRVTLPLKPPCGVMVIVLVPLDPCVMLTLAGEADKVKLGLAGPVSALISADPAGLPQPVAKS